jgi:hypothetical protein
MIRFKVLSNRELTITGPNLLAVLWSHFVRPLAKEIISAYTGSLIHCLYIFIRA